MVPERVRMSNGGEALEDVIGRGEEEELPEFRNGAFEVDGGVGGETYNEGADRVDSGCAE